MCLIRWYFRGFATRIDREHPGPHYPGTIGAEWARFAELLRSV